MKYYKYQISVIPKEPFSDLLKAQLGDNLFETFVDTPDGFDAYIAEADWSEQLNEIVLDGFPDVEISFEKEAVEEQNWNDEWERNFDPITIADQCHIRATFHPVQDQFKYQIVIDPKMSFGTGHHQTTTMMVQHTLEMDFENKDVLDMGAGTAVLAILAGMKKAKNIMAIDIDEWAYSNALENILLNNLESIKVLQGGAEILGNDTFDVIFANINRNILLNDMKHYARVLNKGGEILLSGFYQEDVPLIKAECERNGLNFVSSKNIDNWVALKFKS